MIKYLKILITILMLSSFQKGYCANKTASQEFSANLGELLYIEEVIVEDQSCFKPGDFLTCMCVKEKKLLEPTREIYELAPVKVTVRTNLASPIQINAAFEKLECKKSRHCIDCQLLKVSPEKMVIEHPYDGIESCNFKPYAIITPETEKGTYEGVLMFTVEPKL